MFQRRLFSQLARLSFRYSSTKWLVVLVTTLLTGCGGGSSNDGNNGQAGTVDGSVTTSTSGLFPTPRQDEQAKLMPVEPDAPYSDVIVACVTVESARDACSLDTLPLIVQETPNPDIAAVMARTVVSDAWMGERFREVLAAEPQALLQLFGAVTAVVISRDIRPSYYTPLSGAIYIDPAGLWLNNVEKNTIDKTDDYRSDFGDDLSFVPLWRYVDGTARAWDYYSLEGDETRNLNDIVRPVAALLFHELAHANDLVQPSEISNVDTTLTVLEVADSLLDTNVSAQLDGFLPLNSAIWKGLGQVLYQGAEATPAQQSLQASQVGIEFENDGANAAYSYSTIYEDTANLFEEVMMKFYFDVDREQAFSEQPPVGREAFCDSYIIKWGARSRANDPRVRPRAELVLQELLDQTNVDGFLASLATTQQLLNNRNWCEVQTLGTPPAIGAATAGGGDPQLTPIGTDRRRPWH